MNLKDKTILFLGSSVTYGSASGGVSFADVISETFGINIIKEAVSGTTLADISEFSYVARLKSISPDTHIDLFVCQLSTNDASRKIYPFLTEDAIRFIVTYVRETFACPVMFYTGTYYESERYAAMVELLLKLQKEYGFYILDLYNDPEMRAVSAEDYAVYMKDKVHPTLIGYTEWWTPKFIKFIESLQ